MDNCLCRKLSTGCTEVVQNLHAAEKIARLWKNMKIALLKIRIFWGGGLFYHCLPLGQFCCTDIQNFIACVVIIVNRLFHTYGIILEQYLTLASCLLCDQVDTLRFMAMARFCKRLKSVGFCLHSSKAVMRIEICSLFYFADMILAASTQGYVSLVTRVTDLITNSYNWL